MNLNLNRTRTVRALAIAGVTIGLASLQLAEVQADGPLSFLQRKSGKTSNSSRQSTTRLFFTSSHWEHVLDSVAKDTGATLVADRFPGGRYSRRDIRKYSRSQAVHILDEELEKLGFRLRENGQELVLIDLKVRGVEYQRQAQTAVDNAAPRPAAVTDIGVAGRQRSFEQSVATIRPGESRVSQTAQSSLPGPRMQGSVRQAGYQAATAADEPPAATPEKDAKPHEFTFKPTSRTARALSSTLFSAFRDRAEVVEEGPGGLPAMQVYSARSPTDERSVLFAVAVDLRTGEMLVEGEKAQVERIVRLLQRLDVAPKQLDEATRVLATDKDAAAVAKNLQPAVDRLVAQNNQPGTDPAATPPDPNVPKEPTDDKPMSLPELVGGIRGNVSVEAMDGVLILTGNAADVDAVMAIVRQIEELSALTAPDIHLRMLSNVNSMALAELLTTVYTQLNQARRGTAQEGAQINVIAVGRPNAVLILAPTVELESVLKLIDELDTPVNPHTSFAVFTLKHGIASLVQQLITEFYSDRGGLETRATVVSDVRTNSLIVLAKPNDLKEIAALIKRLDRNDSGAVSEVRVIELKHSAAEDLANTVNQVIQSVLNPPQLGQGQLGQAFLGFGGGNASQALREVRSAVLEYLVVDNADERRLRSGILGDIRIIGDPRSNSIVITAPRESLDLVEQLVRRLDRPSSTVATIKHFTLKNADATSVTGLLTELFGNQTVGQNQQVGVQLAGAESAASIVPLRFSTDVRTNSIVAVGPAEALELVEALLFRLDESDIRARETTIVRLKNAPAADIAEAIDAFLRQQTTLLQSAGTGLISSFELVDRQVIVQAEPYTNSLLISATPRYFDQIREMVVTLDRELAQVVIQALLVEVVLDNTDEFGVELGFQDSLLFNRSLSTGADLLTRNVTIPAIGGTPATTEQVIVSQAAQPGFLFNSATLGNNISAMAGGQPSQVAAQGLSNLSLGRINGDLGFGGLVLSAGSESVNVLLRALASKRQIEILSRPQIRTLDNRPALIRTVKEQQRVNGFQTNTVTGGFNPLVEQAQAGIILEVTPTISPDGNILINIKAEKSQFDNNSGVVLATDPISGAAIRATVKDLTQAESTVVVADEQTIVLGGLITKSTDHLERKVPWLGDLPLLGAAFRYDALITKRTELLIFLTPRIVKGHEYGEMLKQIEADRLHFTEFEAEQIHGPLYGIPAPSTGVGTDNWKTLTPPAPVPPAEGATPSVTPDDDSSAGLDGLKVPEAPAAAD